MCGSGKTSACIRMMNERTDKRFLFVTQYLDEVKRIIAGCHDRGFVEPAFDPSGRRTKLANLVSLLKKGENIATTHSLFSSYTEEIRDLIRKWGYVLVLDEAVDVLCLSDISSSDMEVLLRSGVMKEENGTFQWNGGESGTGVDVGESRFSEEVRLSRSKELIKHGDGCFLWATIPDLFECFSDAYVLTYMFYAQNLRCFFDSHRIGYKLIGVKSSNGEYEFCEIEHMNRARDLRDLVHIIDKKKLNSIGDGKTDLSYSWYTRRLINDENNDLVTLGKNIYNVFHNIFKTSAKEALWSTFESCKCMLSGTRYKNNFLVFNTKATNAYTHKKYLAYCVNNFARPVEAKYYRDHGVKINEDGYALSIMIQWIFRSAIRKGEEIWVYIPSARMRTLFIQWLNLLADGNDLEPVNYKKGENR